MGWDINRFPDKHNIIDSLICSVCTDVVEDPVQTPCEHCFCRACITQWLQEGHNSCPVDRAGLTLNSLKPLNRMARQVLNKLNVYCKNYTEGCVLMTSFENISKLVEHESKGCNNIQKENHGATSLQQVQVQQVQKPISWSRVPIRFQMMKQSEPIPDGWRVASLDDVSKYRQKAHSAINLQWAICTLDDGKITGPGYNYETEQGCFPNLGHKLAINSNFNMTDSKRSKENGKHYCGKRLDGPPCTCCNGYCGPTNGCNCSSCMKLDIRGLPCGTLVNRHGSTSSRSNQTGLFYCGMKVMVGVQGCDGYCGPTNGPNCQACKILQSQANTRYRI